MICMQSRKFASLHRLTVGKLTSRGEVDNDAASGRGPERAAGAATSKHIRICMNVILCCGFNPDCLWCVWVVASEYSARE